MRSLINKRDALTPIIDSCAADVVALTETWLTDKIYSEELFHCDKNYVVYRRDRDLKPGGGVLIAVADNIVSARIALTTSLELVCVRAVIDHQNTLICACYRPPNAPTTFCDELHDVLNFLVSEFPHSPLLLLGDFNFPRISWASQFPSVFGSSAESQSFINLCLNFNLAQLVSGPTRTGTTSSNTLDLVLVSNPNLVHSLTCLPGISDHCFYIFL